MTKRQVVRWPCCCIPCHAPVPRPHAAPDATTAHDQLGMDHCKPFIQHLSRVDRIPPSSWSVTSTRRGVYALANPARPVPIHRQTPRLQPQPPSSFTPTSSSRPPPPPPSQVFCQPILFSRPAAMEILSLAAIRPPAGRLACARPFSLSPSSFFAIIFSARREIRGQGPNARRLVGEVGSIGPRSTIWEGGAAAAR